MRALLFAIFLALAASPCAFAINGFHVPLFRQVAGEIRRVVVAPGDNIVSLAARLGVSWKTLAAANGIPDPDRIRTGQVLSVDTRRIVPSVIDGGVVINVPEAMLYRFETGDLSARYPVGLGRRRWPTPLGSFTVLFRESDPKWNVPGSLEEEIQREREIVLKKAAPGPENSLGKYWIQLSTWGYGIHGTPFTASISQFLSHGCIRLGNPGIEDLHGRVGKGTRVEITYLPVKLAVTPSGEVWAEAHPDVYGLGIPTTEAVLAVLQRGELADRVDVEALDRVLQTQSGVAHRVGGPPANAANAEAPAETTAEAATPATAEATEETEPALWRCLDCPPGPNRRVTFQIEAREPIELPNPFPIEIRDDSGQVVFRPQMLAQVVVSLESGQTRNFVWEVRDTAGQPLPAGSYTASIRFFASGNGDKRSLTLPLWVGK
jgi:L,D-transpeptidase ErfK/SrfK